MAKISELNPRPKEAAFACASSTGYQQGLTKREYYSAMAMQGILASLDGSDTFYTASGIESIVKDSIRHADELLKQLEQ